MKKYKYLGKLFQKTIILGLGGVITGLLLLLLVYALPTAPMKQNVKSSADIWYSTGAWPMLITGYSSTTLDNYTDSMMQGVAVFDNEESVLTKAIKNYYPMQSTEVLPFDSLYAYLQGADCYGENYARYWHGYLVVLKPLLLFFSYSDLRTLNAVALCLLTAYTTYLISKKLSKGVGAIFLTTILFLMPLTLFFCLDMANMTYLTLFALIVLLKKWDFWQKEDNALFYFFAIGMATSYFDFLTYPMITLGIPLVTYMGLLIYRSSQSLKANHTLPPIIFWGLGYGGMWGSKWILASLISGENIVLNALRTARKRSNLQATGNGLAGRFQAIEDNVAVLFQGIYGIALALLIMILIGCIIRSYIKSPANKSCLWWFLPVAIIPFLWLFVTSEHASIHSWFTYRNLVVSIYSLGMLGCCSPYLGRKHSSKQELG